MQQLANTSQKNIFSFLIFILIAFFSFVIPWGCVINYNDAFPLYSWPMYAIAICFLFFSLSKKRVDVPILLLLYFLLFLIISLISWVFGYNYTNRSASFSWALVSRFFLTVSLYCAFLDRPKIKELSMLLFCFGGTLAFTLLFLGFNEGHIARYWLTNGNPNELGFIFCFCISFGIYLIKNKQKLSVYLYPILFISIIGIILTGSRSAGIAMIGVLIINFMFNKGSKLWVTIIVWVLVFFMLYGAYFYFQESFSTITAWDSHLDGRTDIWNKAIGLFYERPLLGYGAGSFQHVVLVARSGLVGSAPENSIIMQLVETGIIGTIAFVLFIGYIFYKSIKRSTTSLDRRFKLSLICTISLFLLTQSGLYLHTTWFIFAILLV